MKLAEKVGNVSLSDHLTVHKFRVNINRQSFKLLYGDLYSDKVRAIIRELSTNANDSHLSAGKPEAPFEVHLPNDLEPYFYVKDFGTGLSPDQVCGEDGIYITFCDSNKTHSDDYTGCLGLGSKSPLSYTDNFSVESNYNGMKYSYAVFMDQDGQPCITPLGSIETTEPNGIKVEFPVKPADFEEFRGKAAAVLSWFKVRPHVVGCAEFQFESHEYLRRTDRYGVRKERQGESHVIMGNVAYPVNPHDFSYNKITDVERAVLEWGVDLFLDIGDVEFVPSREKLSYTERTTAGVKKFISDAILSIHNELEVQVAQQTSVWKARRMLHDIKHSILGKVRDVATVNFNGKELHAFINFHKIVEKTMPTVDRTMGAYPKCEMVSRKKEHYRRRDEDTIHCDGTRIYWNDMERGGYVRIHNHTRQAGGSAYMVTGVNAAFLEETGLDEVAIKASTLPAPERAKREVTASDGTKTYVKRTTLQQYVPSGSNYVTEWWNDVDVDLRDGGVYVVVSYGQITEGDKKIQPNEIKRVYTALKNLRPDFKLLAIRPAHIAKMEKYKNRWMKFDDYVTAVLMKEMPNQLEKIKLLRQLEALDYEDRYANFLPETFEDYSKFGQFIDLLRKAKEARDDEQANAVLALNEQAKNRFEFTEDNTSLAKLEEKLPNTYPLFKCLEWYGVRRTEFVQNVSEYIRAMDARILDMELMKKEAI
jgi:hypothetical protein